MFRGRSVVAFSVLCMTALGIGCASRRYKPYWAQIIPAEEIQVPGIRHAAKVTDFLYHGSQPNAQGIEELKKLGITTIVDLRGERRSLMKKERREAQSLGMQVVNIPGNGWSAPTDTDIAQFFNLIQNRGEQKFFVHCWLGDDRSGVFVAAFRIAFQHWTPDQAIAEMYLFHYKGFWHPTMASYVRSFPDRLEDSPPLASFRHAALSNSESRSQPPACSPKAQKP